MLKRITKLIVALALLGGSAYAFAQSASDSDQVQDVADNAAASQQQEVVASETEEQHSQDSAGQDVAQVEDEEDASTGRFIPTEQLSQDLGASFPVDI